MLYDFIRLIFTVWCVFGLFCGLALMKRCNFRSVLFLPLLLACGPLSWAFFVLGVFGCRGQDC